MGSSYSQINVEEEKWNKHSLEFDGAVKKTSESYLEKIENKCTIYIAHTPSSWGNVSYQHWFVTNDTYFIEFGSANSNIYCATLNINTNTRSYQKQDATKMSDEIRGRISQILGMSNYSLALRNSEHAANYIFKNRWISLQMDEIEGKLYRCFKNSLLVEKRKLVNTFPSTIVPYVLNYNNKKMYSFLNDHIAVSRFDYYLDNAEDTFNILLLGPTGAGKSHLINVFFNKPVCKSDTSFKSVTQEIYFIRGKGDVYEKKSNSYVNKEIVVTDTVGLCDTEWDDKQILNMIKSRISANCKHVDAVFIVFRCDRLFKEHVENIKKMLDWLGYRRGSNVIKRFRFVGTYAPSLTDEKKEELIKQFEEIFNIVEIKTNYQIKDKNIKLDSLIFTDLPPEETLNSITTERVKDSLEKLSFCRKLPGNCERIEIPSLSSSCALL